LGHQHSFLMKTFITSISFIFFLNCLEAQIYFQSTAGNDGSASAVSVDILSDNTYIVAGNYTALGESQTDYIVANISASGGIIWSRTIGSLGNETVYQVLATIDGGFLISGTTNGYGASQDDILLVKANASGAVAWSKTIGGSGADYARSIIQTSDGGYLLCGALNTSGPNYHMITVRLNADGDVLWKKVTGSDNIIGGDAVELANGGFMLVGGVKNGAYYSIYLSRISPGGDIDWEKACFGNLNSGSYEMMATDDGGFICFGETKDIIGPGNVWVVKFNSSGELLWSRVYSSATEKLRTFAAAQVPDGYAISVYDYATSDTKSGLLTIDQDGNVVSYTNYTTGGASAQSQSVVCNEEGCFLVGKKVVGSQNQMFMVKTDFLGQIGPQCAVMAGEIESVEWPTDVVEIISDQYTSVDVTSVGAFSEGFMMTQEIDCKFSISVEENVVNKTQTISAKIINSTSGNPNRLLLETTIPTTVALSIFSAAGELIVNKSSQKLSNGANWIDLPVLSSGMYAIQILNGDAAFGLKLMVE
jgi:hypothetical protein